MNLHQQWKGLMDMSGEAIARHRDATRQRLTDVLDELLASVADALGRGPREGQ